jgi:hypothetical protein
MINLINLGTRLNRPEPPPATLSQGNQIEPRGGRYGRFLKRSGPFYRA